MPLLSLSSLSSDVLLCVIGCLDADALGALSHTSARHRRHVVGARRAWAAARPADVFRAFLDGDLPTARRLWRVYGFGAIAVSTRCDCSIRGPGAGHCTAYACPNGRYDDNENDVRQTLFSLPFISRRYDYYGRSEFIMMAHVLAATGALDKLCWARDQARRELRREHLDLIKAGTIVGPIQLRAWPARPGEWIQLLWIACACGHLAVAQWAVRGCRGSCRGSRTLNRRGWLVDALAVAATRDRHDIARWLVQTFRPKRSKLTEAVRCANHDQMYYFTRTPTTQTIEYLQECAKAKAATSRPR